MFPLVIIGVAAVFLSGCLSRKAEEKPEPQKNPTPEPSSPMVLKEISTQKPAPEANESVAEHGKAPERKKLSPEELKDMGEKLRQIIKLQENYGFSCPPPDKLPPGVECQELFENPRIDLFDPSSPDRFRERILTPKNQNAPLQI